MDEALVTELETALADTGALLVRIQKYRHGAAPEATLLARRALALGDMARRLHRRDALDRVAGSRLLGEARVLADALRDVLADIQRAPAYRAAVAAHAVADAPALVRLLPEIFAGLEPEPPGADLFIPVAWLRRGRLRPPADVGAEIVQARAAGVPGEGDDVSPGADAALPAVTVATSAPVGEPVVLRIPSDARVAPLLRLRESGELLVHVPRLCVPTAVARVAVRLEVDEQLRVEIEPAAWTAWRTALAAALGEARVPVEAG